jgi:hypothetical protein
MIGGTIKLRCWSLSDSPQTLECDALNIPVDGSVRALETGSDVFAQWPEFLAEMNKHGVRNCGPFRNVTCCAFRDAGGRSCLLRVDDVRSEVSSLVAEHGAHAHLYGFCPPRIPEHAKQLLKDASALLSLCPVAEYVERGAKDPKDVWAAIVAKVAKVQDEIRPTLEQFINGRKRREVEEMVGKTNYLFGKDLAVLRGFDIPWKTTPLDPDR